MSTNSSESSSGCTARMSTKAPASGWPSFNASSIATVDASGWKARSTGEPPSTSPCRRGRIMNIEMPLEILLVEDNPNDVELALHALKKHNLANHIQLVRDGAEALDFLFARGGFSHRDINQIPPGVLLDSKLPTVNAP